MIVDYRNKLTDYSVYLDKSNLRTKTKRDKLSVVKRFLENVSDITEESIQEYMKNLTINTKGTYLRKIKQYCDYLNREGLIDEKEYKRIKDIKGFKNSTMKKKMLVNGVEIKIPYKFQIKPEDWDVCFAQVKYLTQRMLLWFGFNFGFRKSELIHLKWKDINFETQTIKIQPSEPNEYYPKGYKLKTKNSERTIKFTEKQKTIISDYKQKYDTLELKHNYLFYNPKKKNPIGKSNFYDLCQSVKVSVHSEGFTIEQRLRPHVLRYSFATAYYQANGIEGLYTLAKLLGHENIATTQKYLAIDEKELHENMKTGLENMGL